ncbi:MAG TPA: Mur ligase family protein, partial [Deltaproteobacteria bacterium]|nr:Mur ligase family protein [Deltaproteobacteria bacterium]
ILTGQGLLVGATLSPHLSRYTERFRIAGCEVDASELDSVIAELKPVLDDLDLTYFEWTVVIAAALFARRRVAYGIFEIGLGGRLDAANVLEPAVSVITNIALDHMDYLGGTIEAIAREKAAIARPGKDLITAANDGLAVIRAYADGIGARLTTVTEGLAQRTGIPGPRQGLNAALALAAAGALGCAPSEDLLRYALNTAFLPGRIERLGRITLDVAHNPAAMEVLIEHLQREGFEGTAVLGVLKDKDYLSMARMLKTVFPEIFIAPVNSPRTWTDAEMDEVASLGGFTRCPSIGAALDKALQSGLNVLVTGSFYGVGEVRDAVICQGY